MSTHHMNFSLKFNDITQNVNKIVGSQLQKFKSLRGEVPGAFALFFDFYPYPRKQVLIFSGGSWGFVDQETLKILKNQIHPLELYMRAHLEGARLQSFAMDDSNLIFDFGERGALKLSREGKKLSALCDVPGRKKYQVSLEGLEPKAQEPKREDTQNKKFQKLIDKVKSDISDAQNWMETWGPIAQIIEENPSSWNSPQNWSPKHKEIIQKSLDRGDFPQWGAQNLGLLQKTLFSKRRRQLRRLEGATQRLREIENQNPQLYYNKKTTAKASEQQAPKSMGPQKKPGLWIHLGGKIWARIGRSASENDELFRQAKDRDLWFHVRGYAGAHIWVPRGQPEIGKVGDLSAAWIDVLSQLALFNSKLRNSAQGVVDFTERRYLKKIPGAPGQVRILRSETHHARLSPEFESLWLPK